MARLGTHAGDGCQEAKKVQLHLKTSLSVVQSREDHPPGSRDYEDKRQRGGLKTGKPPWYSDTNLSRWKGKNLKG